MVSHDDGAKFSQVAQHAAADIQSKGLEAYGNPGDYRPGFRTQEFWTRWS